MRKDVTECVRAIPCACCGVFAPVRESRNEWVESRIKNEKALKLFY